MNNINHPLGEKHIFYKIEDEKKSREIKLEHEFKGLHRSDLKIHKILKERAMSCEEELLSGFEAILDFKKTVTVFGSARTKESNENYKKARRLAGKICKNGFSILTGGGPGIMEAANRGAYESCGYSLGFNINLPFEQTINPYVTHGLDFDFFSARKMSMFFSAEAYMYFPGGFGTLDEFFQLITLIQTKKAPQTPIILVNSEYWSPLQKFIDDTLLKKYKTISKDDDKLYHILDDENTILEIIKNAPLREDY